MAHCSFLAPAGVSHLSCQSPKVFLTTPWAKAGAAARHSPRPARIRAVRDRFDAMKSPSAAAPPTVPGARFGVRSDHGAAALSSEAPNPARDRAGSGRYDAEIVEDGTVALARMLWSLAPIEKGGLTPTFARHVQSDAQPMARATSTTGAPRTRCGSRPWDGPRSGWRRPGRRSVWASPPP